MSSSHLESPELRSVHSTLSDFRSEFAGLEDAVDTLFNEMDEAFDLLTDRSEELDAETVDLALRESRAAEQRQEASMLTHQLEQLEAELTETRESLTRVTEQYELQLVELRNERDESRDDARAARAEIQKLTDVLAESTRTADDDADYANVEDLENERDALAEELELVRGRAAELYKTVEEQKRELATERSQLADEMKELRRMVQRQSELLVGREGDEPADDERETTDEDGPADPVMESMAASFTRKRSRRRHR